MIHRRTPYVMFSAAFLALWFLALLAIWFLPWWVTLTIGIALILSARSSVGGRLLTWLMFLPFPNIKIKPEVLRDALVEVHKILPVARPELQGYERESDIPREYYECEYYELEVTITPKPQPGPFQYWEYTEIALVNPQTQSDVIEIGFEGDCNVISVNLEGQIVQERAEEGMEDWTLVTGSQRIKMLIGTKKGVQDLVFRYYTETLGSLKLPAR